MGRDRIIVFGYGLMTNRITLVKSLIDLGFIKEDNDIFDITSSPILKDVKVHIDPYSCDYSKVFLSLPRKHFYDDGKFCTGNGIMTNSPEFKPTSDEMAMFHKLADDLHINHDIDYYMFLYGD